MSYFSNPNFYYIQEKPYTPKEIDKFIIKAYKNGRTKVIHGNKKYIVKNEIERIKKEGKIKFKLTKPIPTKSELKKKHAKSKKKISTFEKKEKQSGGGSNNNNTPRTGKRKRINSTSRTSKSTGNSKRRRSKRLSRQKSNKEKVPPNNASLEDLRGLQVAEMVADAQNEHDEAVYYAATTNNSQSTPKKKSSKSRRISQRLSEKRRRNSTSRISNSTGNSKRRRNSPGSNRGRNLPRSISGRSSSRSIRRRSSPRGISRMPFGKSPLSRNSDFRPGTPLSERHAWYHRDENACKEYDKFFDLRGNTKKHHLTDVKKKKLKEKEKKFIKNNFGNDLNRFLYMCFKCIYARCLWENEIIFNKIFGLKSINNKDKDNIKDKLESIIKNNIDTSHIAYIFNICQSIYEHSDGQKIDLFSNLHRHRLIKLNIFKLIYIRVYNNGFIFYQIPKDQRYQIVNKCSEIFYGETLLKIVEIKSNRSTQKTTIVYEEEPRRSPRLATPLIKLHPERISETSLFTPSPIKSIPKGPENLFSTRRRSRRLSSKRNNGERISIHPSPEAEAYLHNSLQMRNKEGTK